MLKKIKLKQILIAITVIGILFPSIVITGSLLTSYRDLMVENYITTVDNEIKRIGESIDSYIYQEIISPSDNLLYDEEFLLLLNGFDVASYESKEQSVEEEKLISIYLLNAYLIKNNYYGMGDSLLSILIDENDEIYNLGAPLLELDEEIDFIDYVIHEEERKYINFLWYPLVENTFMYDTDNPRNDYVIPITRNIVSANNQRYYGKQVLLLQEEVIHELYQDNEFITEHIFYIIDEEGYLVSHTDKTQLEIGRKIVVDEGISEDKANYVSTFQLEENGWTIVADVKLQSIYEIVQEANVENWINIGMLLVVLILIMIGISNIVTRPIYHLMDSINQASKYDFRGEIKEAGTKDTIELVRNYNALLRSIDNLIYREYEIKKRKQQAELDVLISQINPHFLYNTLESIVWQARAAGISKVADMAYYLGQLFNITVSKGKSIIKISSEIEHVKLYVNLQNMRYQDRINLKVSWDDEIILEERTLKLILQPFVENAIIHGLKTKDTITIYIHIENQDNDIIFYIEDDGIGISEETLEKIQEELREGNKLYEIEKENITKNRDMGIGMTNVHQRIVLYYGERYGINIKSKNNEGTCIEIRIPSN